MPVMPPRHVGPIGLYFLTISSMIGSSWLFSALYTAQIAGPAGVVSIALGGAMMLVVALIFAEIGGIVPVSGGSARIPHATHGDYASFTAAVLNWLGYVAVAPLEVMAIVEYMSDLFPWLDRTEGGTVSLTPAGIAVCVPLLFVIALINQRGVRFLARANTPLAAWKLAVPVITLVALLLSRFEPENFTAHGGFAPMGWQGVLGAIASGGAVVAFLGFRSTLELAGEVKNGARVVPRVVVASLLTTLVVYVALSVAFVGSLASSDLANGWDKLSDSTGAGPFTTIAAALGLSWLATILYVDAAISPGGTGLIMAGVTARINRAIALNGHGPAFLARLNRFGVPGLSLWINFAVGLALLLPFPGWQAMMTVVSSSLVLSLVFGVASFAALRRQLPDRPRSFRIRAGPLVAAVAFVVSALVVYWAGWRTVQLVIPAALAAFVLLPLAARFFGGAMPRAADLRAMMWLPPYLLALLGVSAVGNYGGTGALPPGLDLGAIAIVGLAAYFAASRLHLQADEMTRRIDAMLAQGGVDN